MQKDSSVTFRAILLGVFLTIVSSYWASIGLGLASLPLFIAPVFILFLTTLLNLLLVKYSPKLALTRSELLVIYIMVVMATSLAGDDTLPVLFGEIAHPFWFATPENEWEDLFIRYIPSWFTVTDRGILEGFYKGKSSFYTKEHFIAWLTPLATWGAFTFALIFMMLCINIIIRKEWIENEKLAYPIIQLPFRMTEQSNGIGFFKNKTMWTAFLIVAAIDILNGFNALYPTVPQLNVRWHNIGHLFTSKPWSAMRDTLICFFPFAIGLAFFMPLDLSFSCWFFYLFKKAEQVFGSMTGAQSLPGFPYFDGQSSGAWLGLFVLALWVSKRHLKSVFKKVIGQKKSIDDSKEPMSYRWAFIGAIFCMFFLTLFCFLAGMSIMVALTFFAIYFAISIAITRARAELASPQQMYYENPSHIMVSAAGSRRFSPANLTIFSYFHWFNRLYRSHPMPNQLEAFKIADIVSINSKKLLIAILVATVVGFLATFLANLDINYRSGAVVGRSSYLGFSVFAGWEAFNRLQMWLYNPTSTNYPFLISMVIGFFFTLILMIMRMRYFWWPFHPAGYALAASTSMDLFWFPFFISWAIKWIIVKRGGVGAHRKAVPFFLGLILGEYMFGAIWSIIGHAMGTLHYYFIF